MAPSQFTFRGLCLNFQKASKLSFLLFNSNNDEFKVDARIHHPLFGGVCLCRRRPLDPSPSRGSSASSMEEDHHDGPAEASQAPSDEAAPTLEPSLAIVPFGPAQAPLPTLVRRFLFGAAPPSAISGSLSIVNRASLQILNLTILPARVSIISIFREAQLQEVVIWCKKICYFVFFSISQAGEMVHICIVVEFSFSLSGVTISVCSYIRGSGVTFMTSPPSAAEIYDATILPPRPQLAAGPEPTSSASSDRQLVIITRTSPLLSLSRASSAGLGLTSDGSGNFTGLFSSDSSPSSLSSLSRTTSGSSEEIQEEINIEHAWLEFAKPTPHNSVIPRPPPPPPRAAKVDEVALRIQAWRDAMRRLIKRRRKSSSWWRKVGRKLLKDLEKRGPALY